VLALVAVGCAAPFVESRPSAPSAGVSMAYCGSATVSSDSLARSLEPPSDLPAEVGGHPIEPPKEVRFCLRVANHAARPVRLDRSRLVLRCPRERQSWVPDADAEELLVQPGETRELHVRFRYSPLAPGEDVELVFESALSAGGRPLKLMPLSLRKN
jgi:hypothetical protein